MSGTLPGGGEPTVARSGAGDSNSIFVDPAVRRMAWLAAFMLIAFLATIVGALFFGILNPPAPRTAVERDLAIAAATIESNEASATPEDWYVYADALVSAAQYVKAERVIETARSNGIEDPAKQYFGLVAARLALARGDHQRALEESEAAMKALETQLEVEREAYEASKQPSVMIAEGLGANYESLRLIRAEAYEALGRFDEAISELDAYLDGNPRAADILVWRGDLRVENGDREGALADYKSASTYLPGDEALAEKLADLGASNE